MQYVHGGDIYTHPGVIDFSASLNPLGMPQAARIALREGVGAFEAYPDPESRELTAALAAFEGVTAEWVLPCAGATDALARLCQTLRPGRALVCAPCYAGYEEALAQVDAQVVCHRLRAEDDFAVGADLAEALEGDVRLVFLANPNNPTGLPLERATLVACLERAAEIGAVVALDECFVDLTGVTGSTDLLERFPHLVLIKALTKTYALAGLRVGYALCSDGELLEGMRRAGQMWAVSVPAQVAGVACLRDADYLRRSVAVIAGERARLREGLTALGLRVVNGTANYLLFKGPVGLRDPLLAEGLLVRPCASFAGLGPDWYRVAVRTEGENAQLLAALEKVMR